MLYTDVDWDRADDYLGAGGRETADVDAAELVSSGLPNSNGLVHAPVLDLDVPHTLIPSTTLGHSHLYIDTPIPWSEYKRLLVLLGKVGILDSAYVSISLARGRSQVRVPWLKKS